MIVRLDQPFRMPVQWINRPEPRFSRLCRHRSPPVVSTRGDEIVVAGSGRACRPSRASSPSTATRTVRRRRARRSPSRSPTRSTWRAATCSLCPRRARQVGRPVRGAPDLDERRTDAVRPILSPQARHAHRPGDGAARWRYRLDINTFAEDEAATLAPQRGRAWRPSSPPRRSPSTRYADNATTGAFILIDRETNQTVAAGMVADSLRRATNVFRQDFAVEPHRSRAAQASAGGRAVVHRPIRAPASLRSPAFGGEPR